MADTIAFTTQSASSAPAARSSPANVRRIRLLSRGLAVLFTVLFGLTVAAHAILLAAGLVYPDHIYTGPQGAELVLSSTDRATIGMVALSTQPLITRLAGAVDLILAAIPILAILWHLRALFRLYAAGTVFARDNATHIKRIGVWLIAFLPVKFAANMIFQAAGGLDAKWLHAAGVYGIVLGAIVLVIAQVMEVGREIEEERAEFV
ncbi:MAG: DUF2975 domain-containing protein [Alphaproteobacteria bacterium]